MKELLSRTSPVQIAVPQSGHNRDYWDGLIDEGDAAEFMGVTVRCLQNWRHRGGGVKYLRLSHRCIRYRRADLHDWAEARVRTSTSDPGAEAA